ncbi:MAG: type II toxin-antitoxin system VapC family toxin [Actinomycetota bacterium]
MTTAATDVRVYVDASALVKLVVDEPESVALRRFVESSRPRLATSELAIVELLRAVRVAGSGADGIRRAREELDATELLDVDRELLETAVSWTSARVRSLDAIHLASALRIGAREMLVYDRRLAEAAEAAGLEVLSPGA